MPNPNGTIGLGITIASTLGGQAVHVDAAIGLATLGSRRTQWRVAGLVTA